MTGIFASSITTAQPLKKEAGTETLKRSQACVQFIPLLSVWFPPGKQNICSFERL